MAGLVELKKTDLAILMAKDAQTVIDVWDEWNKLFTGFCGKSEALEHREDYLQDFKMLKDAFFRILDAIWLARDGSPVVAKYSNDEVGDIASHFKFHFDLGPPFPGEPARWQTLRTLQKRLMEDLDNYQDEVLLSKEIPGTTPGGDTSPEADKTAAPCERSEVRTFSQWQDVLEWSSRTWLRRREKFPESFHDVPGENSCRISEPHLSDWLASAKNKTETEQVAITAAREKSQIR